MADRTHLHRAAQRGDIGAVRALVQAVDVNLRGGWRVESPLHAASRAGRPDVIACLVGAGAHTEVRDRNNDTPLLLAAWLGHAEAIAKLLASGARVDANGIPRSALHCACMQGHAGCVEELLRGGADENAEDEDGNTPAQVVGTMSESLERAEDVVLIHEMLRCAPADRAWRRRGWLVLLRTRDCVAVSLLVPPPPPPAPIAVTTRSAARRGAGVLDAVDGGSGSGSNSSNSSSSSSSSSKAFVGSIPAESFEEQERGAAGHSQLSRKQAVGTRGNRGGKQVVAAGTSDSRGGGNRKMSPKRSPAAVQGGRSVSAPGKAKYCSKKEGGRGTTKFHRGGGSGGGGRDGGRRGAESAKDVASQQALADLVARLIGLGEEGAFRSVLSFL